MKLNSRLSLRLVGGSCALTVGLLLWLPSLWGGAAGVGYSAKVTRVFDGDTVWVRPADGGRSRKLRIDGIDAPEICQTGGRAARDALELRLRNQTVWVRERAKDVYGRPLASLTLHGDNVAGWMVKQGWAWSYRWHGDPGPFASEEATARSAQRGIFSGREVAMEPRQFRRSHGPCQRH